MSASYGSPTDASVSIRQSQMDDMKSFLATAPHHQWENPIKSFRLPNGESISCVLWDDLFHISGTDIVRSLVFRFYAFGRPVVNIKKFEEGIFSDLRNLKPGQDASLEDPRSELLDMLYKNNCIRTKKKQKVFYWFSVPHDRLFLDALERDLKREKMGLEPTTKSMAKPATSLTVDSTQELFQEMRKGSPPLKTRIPNSTISLQVTPTSNEIKRSRVNSVPTQYWHESVQSSQSLDYKKQKAYFGKMNDKRRGRALSSSQSSPIGVRKHDQSYQAPTKSTSFSRVSSFGPPPQTRKSNNNQSRLAMAAYRAGLAQPDTMSIPWNNNDLYSIEPQEMLGNVCQVDMLTCYLCGEGFSETTSLTEHQRNVHPLKEKDCMLMPDYILNNSQQWNLLEMQGTNECLFPVYDPIYDLSATTSSTGSSPYYEDDLSSSTVSSPSDVFNRMTLLQPYKPIFQQEEDMIDQSLLSYADPFINFSFGV
ncbi:hypothetical protein G6F56_002473 [Rhizopus delemar]|nr:hypothetical protein G6F56_002473 [Rhizopus delemar]